MPDEDVEISGEVDIGLVKDVGAFSFKALQKAKSMVKVGIRLIDVADAVERLLKENGYTPAFPLNLSVNNEAAHYTPTLNDEKVFREGDLVKVDFGAAKDGILGDNAVTVDLGGNNSALIQAAEEAVAAGVATVKAGVEVGRVGRAIEEAITKRGFRPIKNLGGHGVEVHDLHASVFIPNYDNKDDTTLEEGQVIAIEPFATDGKRELVVESDICEIFSFYGEVPVRHPIARKIQSELSSNYKSEPFAARWLSNVAATRFELYSGLTELYRAGALERYPILVLPEGSMVAQHEVEVLVEKDSCSVLTK